MGRLFELTKKFEGEIESWTDDDTDEYARLMNWRVRLLNRFKGRLHYAVWELKRIYQQTGEQPRDVGVAKLTEIYARSPEGKPSWFEKAIISQWSWNAVLALTIISVAIVSEFRL